MGRTNAAYETKHETKGNFVNVSVFIPFSEKLLSTNSETTPSLEAHSKLFQTSKMEHFEKIVNGFSR